MNASYPKIQSDTWKIPAGGVLEVHRRGQFLKCADATERFKIAFDDGPETEFRKGLTFTPETGYSKVRLINVNQSEITVELIFGEGGIVDNGMVFEGAVEVEPLSAPEFKAPAPEIIGAGAVQLVAARNLNRRELALRNLSPSERIWVQDTATTALTGWPLDGKEGVILTTTDEVFIYNPSGVAISVAMFETGGDVK